MLPYQASQTALQVCLLPETYLVDCGMSLREACGTSTATQRCGAEVQALTEGSPVGLLIGTFGILGVGVPALRKGPHNPKCCLGQVPSLVSSTLPWKGAASITSNVSVTAPVLGQPGLQEWHLTPWDQLSGVLKQKSGHINKSCKLLPVSHTNMDAQA